MTSTAVRATLLLSFVVAAAAACGPKVTRTAPAGGDPSTVTSDDLQGGNVPIEIALQRKVPGLIVRRTGDGGIALRVRGGAAGFDGKDQPPLYILNGTPFRPGDDGELTGINPYDIETIKVLRGADAAIYGLNGANGVIVITTKTGRRKS